MESNNNNCIKNKKDIYIIETKHIGEKTIKELLKEVINPNSIPAKTN